MMSIWAIKRAHPLYSWWDSVLEWHRLRQQSLEPLPWNQIGMGLAIVLLCLVILAQAIHAQFPREESWLCTRRDFGTAWVKDTLTAHFPCSEYTHLRTGEVRVTEFAKAKRNREQQ